MNGIGMRGGLVVSKNMSVMLSLSKHLDCGRVVLLRYARCLACVQHDVFEVTVLAGLQKRQAQLPQEFIMQGGGVGYGLVGTH